MSNLIIIPYANPPASGVMWAYEGLQNAGFVPKTMAAEGIGFAAIKPFTNLWKIFRDLSYMLLVIVLIAIGFMIMFRAKINPQTVISVENALPKIVIALILITFSFAIAGFLIDMMYVLIVLIISILSKNDVVHINTQEYQNAILGGSLGGGWFVFGKLQNIWGMGNAMLSLFPFAIRSILSMIVTVVTYFLLQAVPFIHPFMTGKVLEGAAGTGGILSTLWGILTTPTWFGLAFLLGFTFIGPFIISLLVWFTAVFLLFRIIAMLFKAFIELVILIIFAPIILLFEAIPGKSVFSWWFKNLLAEIITFPLIIIIFIVGYIITGSFAAAGNTMWAPPFLYGMDPNAFSVVLGIGLMFLIPDIIKLVKELLGVKGLPLSFGPGMFFAGAGTAIGGGMGVLGQFGSISLATGAIGKMVTGRRHGLSGMVGALFGQEFEASRKGGAAATGTNVPKADAPPSTQ